MTQKTKLQILGPYTPDHEGPFCTRDGRNIEVKFKDGRGEYPVNGYIEDDITLTTWDINGSYHGTECVSDLMNAREVPVLRVFWVNEYDNGNLVVYDKPEKAQEFQVCLLRTIHVREVLPGEGE